MFLFCRSFLKDFALEVMQQNRHKVTVPFSYGSLVSGLIHPSDLHGKIYGQFMGNMGKSTYNWSELNHLDEQLSYWVLLMRFSWAINGVTCWLTTLLISKKATPTYKRNYYGQARLASYHSFLFQKRSVYTMFQNKINNKANIHVNIIDTWWLVDGLKPPPKRWTKEVFQP